MKKTCQAYDYIYLDPPFDFKRKSELIKFAQEALIKDKPSSRLIIHYPYQEQLTVPSSLLSVKKKRYSGSALELFALKKFFNPSQVSGS